MKVMNYMYLLSTVGSKLHSRWCSEWHCLWCYKLHTMSRTRTLCHDSGVVWRDKNRCNKNNNQRQGKPKQKNEQRKQNQEDGNTNRTKTSAFCCCCWWWCCLLLLHMKTCTNYSRATQWFEYQILVVNVFIRWAENFPSLQFWNLSSSFSCCHI